MNTWGLTFSGTEFQSVNICLLIVSSSKCNFSLLFLRFLINIRLKVNKDCGKNAMNIRYIDDVHLRNLL